MLDRCLNNRVNLYLKGAFYVPKQNHPSTVVSHQRWKNGTCDEVLLQNIFTQL